MKKTALALPLLLGAGALPAAALAAAPDTVTTVTGVGLASPMNVNSLLPVVNNDSVGNFQAVQQLYRPLIWLSTDLKIDWTDSIAQSIKVSDDRTVFTVTLKDWKWSDGKPVTAADAAYGFKMIKDFGPRYQNTGIGGIPGIVKSFDVIDAHTFRMVLKHPVNTTWFELNGLSQITPAPAFAWKQYSIDYLYNHQTDPALVQVVDGPYKLAKFAQGREMAFVPNPAYSGHPPSIKHFVFKMVTSADAAFAALKTGDIQIGNVPPSLYNARRLVAHLKSMQTQGGFSFEYLPINFSNPKVAFFRDLKVRQALEYAMDQQLIIKTVMHGIGIPGFSPVPAAPETYLSPEMKALIAHPGKMYQPAKAKKLLDEAGWKIGPDGIRVKDGKKLEFSFIVPSGTAWRLATAQVLKQEWQAIGVEMHIRQMTFNQEIATLESHKGWDMAIIGWTYSPDYYPSGGGLFNTGGGTNYGLYSDPKMDKLIEATMQAKGLKTLYAYENYAAAQLPVLYIPQPGYLVKYDSRLNGMNRFYNPVGFMATEYLSYHSAH
ncbi:MAG: peptide ABC transporter substrate-binding protein [Acidihalobacter sp.]|uniref:peptide ABC transporter substrate-binding protein n=1 Tax=Acidihalobacter sp. TaxID=1872108 RepID=UPI00307E3899